MSSGVPQRSVLGSVLFLVYINYLPNDLVCKQDAFADYYKIYLHYNRVVGYDGMATLQEDLDRLVAVASSWNLSLNISKCVIMRLSWHYSGWDTLGKGFQYKIGNSVLEIVNCCRDWELKLIWAIKFYFHLGESV